MASFSRKTGIIGALVIAGVLVVGSVVISGAGLSFLNPSTANAASTQSLLQALATRDSGNDGVPDWEVELYGGDPSNPHSFSPTLTNGQAIAEGLVQPKFLTEAADASSSQSTDADVEPDGITAAPDSLTEQFSQQLLSQYVSQSATDESNGTQPSDSDIATLAQGEMQSFAQNNEHQDAYALGQVRVGGTGAAAMTTYAASAEEVFAEDPITTTESELDYFSDAIEKNDPTALKQVAAIGAYYTQIAPALMQISVPSEAENAHLEIANAASHLGADITDLSMMNTDPLRAYLGLAQYQVDTVALSKGFSDMNAAFNQDQVTIASDAPGYDFYDTCSLAAAQSPQ